MSVAANTLYRSNVNAAGLNDGFNNPGTQPLQLPKIVHSASKATDPHFLNVTARGVSRASSLNDMLEKLDDNNNKSRPMPFELNEDSLMSFKKSKAKARSSQLMGKNLSNDFHYSVPDGVKTVYSPDVTKTSIPIFGNRPESMNKNHTTNKSLPATPTFQKAEVEELYQFLKDKVRGNYHETKTKFKNADPDGKGTVTKDALAHVIASILGPSRPMSHQQFQRLLEKLGLKNKSLVKFEDFVACFQEVRNESSEWVDPIRANQPVASHGTGVVRKATQVFVILKEKCKQRSKDISTLVPQLIGGNPNRIFKPELLNCINLMNIKMENEEYDKLWKKFDADNLGVVQSEAFLKKLGIFDRSDSRNDSPDYYNTRKGDFADVPLPSIPVESNNAHSYNNNAPPKSSSRTSSKNPIEKWLKRRFREGFFQMKQSFEDIDLNKTGYVKKEQFLNVLRRYGLKLETHLLDAFLQRCDLSIEGNLVSYTKFLEKFQNRSEQGLTYKLITNGLETDRAESAIGYIEKRLVKMFQKDFLSLLTIFRKLDRNKTNTLSKSEFRAALESHFGVEMSDEEFQEFIKDLPTEDQRIKYLEFMSRFDTDDTATLFDYQSVHGDITPPLKKREWEPIEEENEDDLRTSRDIVDTRNVPNTTTGRTLNEVRDLIKNQIRNNYKEVETIWSNIDKINSGCMTKDTCWEFLKNFKISPPITRSELNSLWKEFILKDNNTLEYWQFVRHFGYSKKSAAYQNAKKAPPKRGDCDMMLTSNKLGRDTILIRGSVHAKLRLQCELIRKNFVEIDPYSSGYVLRDEFKEVLCDLCPELNEDEMEILCEKYENPFDGRVNYNLFLQPYTLRIKPVKPTNLVSSRADYNDPVVQKLRYKLGDHFKELRRMFKQKDYKQTGNISVSAFKECLDAKIRLNDEEMYNLLQKLDKDMIGSINYNKFLTEMIKQ